MKLNILCLVAIVIMINLCRCEFPFSKPGQSGINDQDKMRGSSPPGPKGTADVIQGVARPLEAGSYSELSSPVICGPEGNQISYPEVRIDETTAGSLKAFFIPPCSDQLMPLSLQHLEASLLRGYTLGFKKAIYQRIQSANKRSGVALAWGIPRALETLTTTGNQVSDLDLYIKTKTAANWHTTNEYFVEMHITHQNTLREGQSSISTLLFPVSCSYDPSNLICEANDAVQIGALNGNWKLREFFVNVDLSAPSSSNEYKYHGQFFLTRGDLYGNGDITINAKDVLFRVVDATN